jgi:hypothetical protein
MASLPTIPIVIIDEEEVIVIEDESGDEIEILEHGKRHSFNFCLWPYGDAFSSLERLRTQSLKSFLRLDGWSIER